MTAIPRSPEEKLRLRSDAELDAQNKGLVELCEVLKKSDVDYLLSSGTLLGAVREKDFIRWDWDVQLYFKAEDIVHRMDELADTFENSGFKPIKVDRSPVNLKFLLHKYETVYELTAWQRKGNKRIRRHWQLPNSFFEPPATIEFRGHEYPCMNPPEEYLRYCYGDWRTPKRVADKEEYLSGDFYRFPSWYRALIAKTRRFLSMIKRSVLRLAKQ